MSDKDCEVKPRLMHDMQRKHELACAMQKALSEGKEINLEWITEYNELSKRYSDPIYGARSGGYDE